LDLFDLDSGRVRRWGETARRSGRSPARQAPADQPSASV